MSASSQSLSPDNVDPMDLLDLSEYDAVSSFQSPSVTPPMAHKSHFPRPTTGVATPATLPSNQPMTGPSHQYDQYKQQTPFVPGALASTMNMNQTNLTGYNLNYVSPNDEGFDFNADPSQGMDINFDASSEQSFFYAEPTVNPNSIGGRDHLPSPTVPSQTSNVGRMYPGMHQQAAMAKAQAQAAQRMQQQEQQQSPQNQKPRRVAAPSDPIVEEKISQLLSSMRNSGTTLDGDDNSALTHISRSKKDEDEMDEDERLLASEEGKKLTSKERRQLRNKVSARAFRSRRKEYITHLENELTTKTNDNNDLRTQNRALATENRRLSDLTRMLLSSPSFSDFLQHLSTNPNPALAATPAPQHQQAQQPPAPAIKVEQHKDVNPYAVQQQQQQQQQQPHQIGMAMIPEQNMDFGMSNMDSNGFNYQPGVFAVLETPEAPLGIDTVALSGKPTSYASDESEVPTTDKSKMQAPVIPSPVSVAIEEPVAETPQNKKINVDLDSDIYEETITVASQPAELDTGCLGSVDLFGGVESEKALARYELIDASQGELVADIALVRVEQLSASLESSLACLNRLTSQL